MSHGNAITSAMLTVTGLELTATESDLSDLFKPYGEVIWCEICKDKVTRQHLGSGFVSFSEPKHVSKAVNALDLKTHKGQTLHLAPYETPFNSLIVLLELEDYASEDHLRTTFGQFGPLAWTRLVEHQPYEFYFFVTFANHQGAAKAATALRQRKLPIYMFLFSKSVRDPQVPIDTSAKNWNVPEEEVPQTFEGINVRVNNLDPKLNTVGLRNLFSPYGTIISCKATHNPNFYDPGYGRVSFSTKEEAEKAIAELNGKGLHRYAIEVALEDGGKRSRL